MARNLTVRIRPLLLLITIAGCGGPDDAPASQVAGPCGAPGEVALGLTPRSSIALPDSAVPAGLVLLPDGSLVTTQRGSAGVSVSTPGTAEPRWIAAPEPVAVLTLAGDEILGAGLTTVYRIDPAAARAERLMEVPVRAGHIVSLAADAQTVWVGTGSREMSGGAVYAASRARTDAWRHAALEAPVRLEPAGSGQVAAALTRAPHRVVLLDSALQAASRAVPRRGRRRGEDAAWFTQALVALDCGRLLHVVADLRSDRRELNVYQTHPEVRLIRTRTIEQPLGFVHATADGSLVAVTEAEGRREVVLFGWSWQSSQERT